MSNAHLANLAYFDWMKDHGLTPKQLTDWGVVYDATEDRLVVPCNGPDGSWCLDVVRNFSREPQYELRPSNCRPSHILYGLDKTLSAIQECRWAVVVEGWSDALALYFSGVTNVCGAFTAGLSGIQIALLDGIADEIFIWGDDDEAGRAFANKATELEEIQATGLVTVGHDPASFVASGGDPMSVLSYAYDSSKLYSFVEFTKEGRFTGAIYRDSQAGPGLSWENSGEA